MIKIHANDEDSIFDKIKAFQGKSVLEVGCGDGYYTKKIAKYAKHVLAIDKSPECIEMASQRHSKNTEFRTISLEKFRSKRKFDTVVFTFSFHEMPHSIQGRAIKSAHNLVSEGGCIILLDPAPGSFFNKLITKFVDPAEDHDARIIKSNYIVDTFVAKGYLTKSYYKVYTNVIKGENLDELVRYIIKMWSDLNIHDPVFSHWKQYIKKNLIPGEISIKDSLQIQVFHKTRNLSVLDDYSNSDKPWS